MKTKLLLIGLLASATALASTSPASAQDRRICNPGNGISGFFQGRFFTWFENSSQNDRANCDVQILLRSGTTRRFRASWDQNRTFSEDAVGGMGWGSGRAGRRFTYNISTFTSNRALRAIAGIYGWTCVSGDRQRNPRTSAQEYYVIDTWSGSGNFVPFDENRRGPALQLRDRNNNPVFVRDGTNGTYRVYRVRRNGAQFCGDGSPRSFDQFWSVRTTKRATGGNRNINFQPHADRWDDFGFRPNSMSNGYQVLAVEAFGDEAQRHTGVFEATVRER